MFRRRNPGIGRVLLTATAFLALVSTASPALAAGPAAPADLPAILAAHHAGAGYIAGSGGLRMQLRSGHVPAGVSRADVPPEDVTCQVSISAPRYFYDGTHHITTSLSVNCNGPIRRITGSLWLEGSTDGISFDTEANNLEKPAPGTPYIISAQNNSAICLPQYHIGIAFVDVVFLAGDPIEDYGWFGGPEVFIDCPPH